MVISSRLRSSSKASPKRATSISEAIKHHHRACRGKNNLERWLEKVEVRSAERRAAEKRLLRGTNKKLRATSLPTALAAIVTELQPIILDDKMHASDEASGQMQELERCERPEERPAAQIAAASRLRIFKRTREERERAATLATLRAKWKIARSDEERRRLERASQWREAFAIATRTSPRGFEASEDERERRTGEGYEERSVPAVPSDSEEGEDAPEMGALKYITLFGDDADAASELSVLDGMTAIAKSCMLYERGEGVFKPRPSSASSAPVPAASVLFGDEADACAKNTAPPPVEGGFVQPLFGDECESGASIASDSGANGGSASSASSANTSSANVSANPHSLGERRRCQHCYARSQQICDACGETVLLRCKWCNNLLCTLCAPSLDNGASGVSASGSSSANKSSASASAAPLDEEAESDEQPAVGSPFRGVDAGEKEKVAAIADQILSDI